MVFLSVYERDQAARLSATGENQSETSGSFLVYIATHFENKSRQEDLNH